eukprot:TRINITY_DN6892_c0_g1_i2.p2 TRINITY_DN6892_c0_g1~~TRINITY_DN6892_c0_g1_i2.p2  ORF type:complete len:155 (+),score=43.89 TRINITY_DN6892_c0_g1_i2:833-1297(+)
MQKTLLFVVARPPFNADPSHPYSPMQLIFKPDTTLTEVYTRVTADIIPHDPYILVQTYPRRKLDVSELGSKTLSELQLVPRAQLVVKLREGGASMRKPNICESIVAAIKAFFSSPPPPSAQTTSDMPRPSRPGPRERKEDYNGNSTMLDSNPNP